MSDSSPSARRVLAWTVSAVLVAVGGFALHVSRGALADGLDRLPDLARLTAPEPPPPPLPPPPPPPPPEEPVGPQFTHDEIAVMLEPLPEQVLELVAEGRSELPDFADIGADDPVRAERSRRFFGNWARTWSNRVGQLEAAAPPAEECALHADLEPGCALLTEAICILRQVPEVTRVDDGQDLLDAAERIVEFFLRPPEEEAEDLTAEKTSPPD